MKTKLDELEQYNRTLESQLGSIFSSISKTVIKVKSEPAELRESEEESETNWKSVRPSSRSDEDVVCCQALAGTQPNTNSILHINENCQEPVKRKATRVKRDEGDLSEIIRYLQMNLFSFSNLFAFPLNSYLQNENHQICSLAQSIFSESFE